jgi:hypothetical protein
VRFTTKIVSYSVDHGFFFFLAHKEAIFTARRKKESTKSPNLRVDHGFGVHLLMCFFSWKVGHNFTNTNYKARTGELVL